MSHEQFDDRTIRERIEANPKPALVWAAVAVVLLALELGRVATWVLKLGEVFVFIGGGIAAVPGWIEGNVAGSLGPIAGTVAYIVTALLLLAVIGVVVKWLFVPVDLVDVLDLDIDPDREYVVERLLVAAGLGVFALLMAVTPLGAVVDAVIGAIVALVEEVSALQTLTSRETIPNQGYRTPAGGWEETFLGLSPAVSWALRVALVFIYAFACLVWAWKGYTTFRRHYREANWTPRDDSINRFRSNNWGIFGLAVVFMFLVMAVWAPALAPVPAEHNLYSPYENEFDYYDEDSDAVLTIAHGTANIQSRSQGGEQNVGPLSYDDFGRWAPFGTNQDGKDLFTFLVYGARTSLIIGLTGMGLATLIALAMSLVTSYYKGLVDLFTILASDTIISIPLFLLVLLLSVIFQQANHPIMDVYDGGLLLALIFAGVYWPGLWRAIRGPSLQVAEEEWVDAAISYGQRPTVTMRKHMAPYVIGYIMIYASLLIGSAIIVTAALSFLGLGINPPTPEWGRMVADGRSYVSTTSWHIATLPGLMVVLVVTGFNALGDGIRDAIDPESDTGGDAGSAAAAGGGA